MTDQDLREAILAQVRRLRPGKTCCPSEVARGLSPDWRPLMEPLRKAAAGLAREGQIRILQRGLPADPDRLRGPIRLGKPEG